VPQTLLIYGEEDTLLRSIIDYSVLFRMKERKTKGITIVGLDSGMLNKTRKPDFGSINKI